MTVREGTDRRRSPLAGTAFGVETPALTMRELPFRSLVEVRGDRPAYDEGWVWPLGPGWWLADGEGPDEPVLEVPAAAALRGVDVSAQRTTIELTGPGALGVLAQGSAVDLERVPVGSAVQGVLAGCQVVLARPADDTWRVLVRASFARHLAAWLTDAAT